MNIFVILLIDILLVILMYMIYSLGVRIRNTKEFEDLYVAEIDNTDEKRAIRVYKIEQRKIIIKTSNKEITMCIGNNDSIQVTYKNDGEKKKDEKSFGDIIEIDETKYIIGKKDEIKNFEEVYQGRANDSPGIPKVMYFIICFVIILLISVAGFIFSWGESNNDESIYKENNNKKVSEVTGNSIKDKSEELDNLNKDLDKRSGLLDEISPTEEENSSQGISSDISESIKNNFDYGISISSYQQEIDWEELKSIENSDFVIIRLGRSTYGKDSYNIKEDVLFRTHLRNALENGFRVGVYFYSCAINMEEAENEAQFVLDTLDNLEEEFNRNKEEFIDFVGFWWENNGEHPEKNRHGDVSIDESIIIANTFSTYISEKGFKPVIGGNAKWISSIKDNELLSQYSFWVYNYPGHEEDNYEEVAESCEYDQYGILDSLNTYDENGAHIGVNLIKKKK